MRGGRKERLDLVVKIFRSSLLCSSALLCSPVCGAGYWFVPARWALESRESCRRSVRQRWRERDLTSQRGPGGGQGEDRGRTGGWWSGQIMVINIIFYSIQNNITSHLNIQSASSDLVNYILKYILYFQYEIIKYFPGSHSVFWLFGRQEREEREIPAGWRCLYISLLCRAALVPPERERIYLALLSLSSSLWSPHIHTVPCRCVYACSDLLCQGKKTQHLVLFLACHVGHEWHNKPISPWLHQCCQDCKNPPTKYRNISVKRFIRKINLIVRFSKYFHSS